VTIPKGIARVLNYNEQKIKTGKAECIYAHQFIKNVEHLHFYEKKNRFENLMMLNKRATTNAIHISLNFSPSEKPDKDKLIDIAVDYMQKIGFDKQPYLVYQHLDAGHPHIHIIATNIQKDGTRISLHNIGRNQSEQARKEIEIEYGMVKATGHKQEVKQSLATVPAQTITYGKSDTKQSITKVVSEVISDYKFTSLPELNAILKMYNGIIIAIVCIIYGAVKGINILILAPFAAIIVIVFIRMPFFASLVGSQTSYMTGLAEFVINFFGVFLLGSILPKYIEVSGAQFTK
jgi:hypothetical protein